MADGTMDERTLNRMLDGIVAGEPVAEPSGIDAELLDTFADLRALALTPPPARAQSRLDRDVDQAIDRLARNPAGWRRPLNGVAPDVARSEQRRNFQASSSSPIPARRALSPAGSAQRLFTRFVFAAVVLIALGLGGFGYVAFGPGFPRHEQRKTIPAAYVAASSTAAADETVLEYTIPAAELPRRSVGSGTTRNTIAPSNRSTWTPSCCPGPMLEYVMAGSYTVRAQAAVRVIRANGSSETVPAGVEVTLGPGDALISRNETVVEATNTGSDTVQLLNWTLIEDTGFSGHLLTGWTNNHPDVQYADALANGPVTVRLRRIELAPGETVPSPPDGTYQFIVPYPVNPEGTPVADPVTANGLNGGTEPITVYLLQVETSPPVATPGASPSPP